MGVFPVGRVPDKEAFINDIVACGTRQGLQTFHNPPGNPQKDTRGYGQKWSLSPGAFT